jgi:hypothetical protein
MRNLITKEVEPDFQSSGYLKCLAAFLKLRELWKQIQTYLN